MKNILVARHGINRINEIKQCIDNYKQISKDIDGMVYNAFAKPKVTTAIIAFMAAILISIMQINTLMIL